MNLSSKIDYCILGAATGYSVDQLLPFVVSLKKTGYCGRLCLFVWDLEPRTIDILQRLGAEIYPCQANKLDKSYTVTGGRFFVFQDFLNNISNESASVMITDVRDVFFQNNPFDKCLGKEVNFFLEEGRYNSDKNNLNSRWVIQSFGKQTLREMSGKHISCVGVTIGGAKEIKSYLDVMTEELTKLDQDFFGSDQAIHNKILHLTKKSYPYRVHDNDNGYVKHLGLVPSDKLRLDARKNVLNCRDEVVSVLHQYDRHGKLLDHIKGTF